MTDIDLMSDLQVWLMLGLAVIVWAVLLRSWWTSSRPRRTRHTYQPAPYRAAHRRHAENKTN